MEVDGIGVDCGRVFWVILDKLSRQFEFATGLSKDTQSRLYAEIMQFILIKEPDLANKQNASFTFGGNKSLQNNIFSKKNLII